MKQCKVILKCFICNKINASRMCKMFDKNKLKEREKSSRNETNRTNFNRNLTVFLQKLKPKIISEYNSNKKDVRLILDAGSLRLYILKHLSQELNLYLIGKKKLSIHFSEES